MKIKKLNRQGQGISYIGSWLGSDAAIEVQLENVYKEGYFKEGYSLAKPDGTLLTPGVDFQWDQRLDFGTYNIYDTMGSGPFATGKYFRLVDSEGRNIKDPGGMGITQIIAKSLVLDLDPPTGVLYVDPILSKFRGIGGITYHSRMDSYDNTVNTPNYAKYTPSFSGTYHGTGGKWGSAWGNSGYGCNRCCGYSSGYLYPQGSVYSNLKSGTLSYWVYADGYSAAGYINGMGYSYFNCGGHVQFRGWMSGLSSGALYLDINGGQVWAEGWYFPSYGWTHVFLVWDKSKNIAGFPGASVVLYRHGSYVYSYTGDLNDPSHAPYAWTQGMQCNHDHYFAGSGWGDNLKLWDNPNISLAASEWNGGAGNQDFIGGGGGTNIKIGYYWLPTSTDPIKLNEPASGADNKAEVQLEPASDLSSGYGYFGNERIICKSNWSQFIKNTDFYYDEALDGSGPHGINIYDDNASGAFDSGRYFRIVSDGKNITDPTGLNKKPIAKELNSVDYLYVPLDEVWIDPLRAKFAGGATPAYWSKGESVANLTNAEIAKYTPSVSGYIYGVTSGKLGNCIVQYAPVGPYTHLTVQGYVYPLGNPYSSNNLQKGTFTAWMNSYTSGNGESAEGGIYFHIPDKILIGMYCYQWSNPVIYLYINGSSVYSNTVSGWQHFYIVWDCDKTLSGGASVKLYINGSLVYTGTQDISIENLTPHIYLKSYARSYDYYHVAWALLDNPILYEGATIDDPTWSYNLGVGREEPLLGLGYVTNVGYYKPNTSGDLQVQLETITDFVLGVGFFGRSHKIGKSNYQILRAGIDFWYDEALDGTGTHVIDIYDDNASGAFDSGKYFRVTYQGKNVTDPTGLNLKPYAKYLEGDTFYVPNGQIWIDPWRGKIAFPSSLLYWSKMSTLENLTELAESAFGGAPYIIDSKATSVDFQNTYGKFGNGLFVLLYATKMWQLYTAPDTVIPNQGTISCWFNMPQRSNNSGILEFITDDVNKLKVEIKCNKTNPMEIKLYIEGAQVGNYNLNQGLQEQGSHHLFITWDKDKNLTGGKSVILWLDGFERISSDATIPSLTDTKNILTLKGNTWADPNYAYIYLDNYKFWNTINENYDGEFASGTGNENYSGGAITVPGDISVGYYRPKDGQSFMNWIIT